MPPSPPDNGDRSASALQPSQLAGKALSTSLEGRTKQAWKEHLTTFANILLMAIQRSY